MAAAKRKCGPTDGKPLGEALKAYLRASGLDTLVRYPGPVKAWQEAVGAEVAEHARVFSFRRGVLEVAVDSSALMNEMEFRRSVLLRAVQARIQRPFVRDLSFVLRTFREESDYDGEDDDA